jgi:Mn2+/Fe2+ NRAMP family transporter
MGKITDQPLRVIAVFVFAPILILKGKKYHDRFLITLGILFIIVELFCIFYMEPKQLE